MTVPLWKPSLTAVFAADQIFGPSSTRSMKFTFTGLLATNFLWTFLQGSMYKPSNRLELLGLPVWGPDDFYDSCFVS